MQHSRGRCPGCFFKNLPVFRYCMAEKAKTSLTLDKELWKKFKLRCVELDRSYTEVVEELVGDWVKKKA